MGFARLEYLPHAERTRRLEDAVSQALSRPLTLRFTAAGADYGVYRAEDSAGARYAVRVPHVEEADTTYDGHVSFAHLIETEMQTHALLLAHGVPCPRVIEVDTSRRSVPWSWMLTEWIEGEPQERWSPAVARQVGELCARIHAIPVPPGSPLQLPSGSWTAFVTERVIVRLEALSRYERLPGRAAWRSLLASAFTSAEPPRLLHMDLRPANTCVRGDRVVALFDMTNALCGNPLMELGRVKAYGLLTQEFLSGYGRVLDDADRRAIELYGLDTTALLALLAREELADPVMYREMADRVRETLLAVTNARRA